MANGHRGHNEGSIYQRKTDGYWCASISVGRDATGRLKRRMIYSKTRKEVQDALARVLKDAQYGLPIDPTRQTVGDYRQPLHKARGPGCCPPDLAFPGGRYWI